MQTYSKMDSSNIMEIDQPSRNLSTPPIPNGALDWNIKSVSGVLPENVILIILGIIAVLVNGILLYVMYKNPLKVFRTKISYLVICLGIADFLTAINGILYGFLLPLEMYPFVLLYFFWATVVVSVCTVFAMCVERWFAILYPFKSSSVYTKRFTLYFCVGVWILGGFISASIRIKPLFVQFVISCIMEFMLLIVVLLYVNIVWHFKKTQRQTSAVEEVAQEPAKMPTDNDVEAAARKKPTKPRSNKSMETQLLVVVTILALILVFTFIPYTLGLQIDYGLLLFSAGWSNESVHLFIRYFFPFKFLNFVLNPFVYAWRLVQYRKSFVLVVWSWGKKRDNGHITSANVTPMAMKTVEDTITDRKRNESNVPKE